MDTRRIVLIGHSMGGFLGANAAAHDPGVSAIVMIAAWDLGGVASNANFSHELDTFQGASPRLTGTTPEGLMAETKQHMTEWNYVDYGNLLTPRPVLILECADTNRGDNRAMAEALRRAGDPHVLEKYIEADHVFSGHRIALQVAILEWLNSLPAPTNK
jgi:pimeloyl-ACP methyl ester carboxylesterase